MTNSEPTPIRITRDALFAASPPERMRSSHLLATVALLAFSALAWIITGAFTLMEWQQSRSAMHAEADVLEIIGSKTPRARVRFVDARGEEHIAEASGPFNGIRATVGQRIPILYWPESLSYVRHDDPGRNWLGPALFAGFACLPLLPIPFMWRQVRRQQQRYARLRQRGLKREVDAVRTESVRWGKFTRWAVVATWRDSFGRAHQTIAGPYTADPGPLDPAVLVVLADPDAAALSVIAPESLPPFDAWRASRRAAPAPRDPR